MDTPPSPWTAWERNFAAQMQRLREARKMTQTDLAKELQRYGLRFHQQTVQRVEAGERPVRLNEAYVIAQIFEVDIKSMTMSGAPADRDVLYAVDRLRRGSGGAATALSELIWEWADDLEPLGLALSERIQRSPESLDEVTLWGLAWVEKIMWAWDDLANAFDHLAQIEGEPARMHDHDPTEAIIPRPDVLEAMHEWIERYDVQGGPDFDTLALKEANELQRDFPGTPESESSAAENRRAETSPSPVTRQLVVEHLRPENYGDAARQISAHVAAGRTLILDVQDMTDEAGRRTVDFAAGVAQGIGGTIEHVKDSMFIIWPPRVSRDLSAVDLGAD